MFEDQGILIFQHFSGDKRVDSSSTDTTSKEQSRKTQNQDDETADPSQDSEKQTGLFCILILKKKKILIRFAQSHSFNEDS